MIIENGNLEELNGDDENYAVKMNEALGALLALGYSEKEAELSLKKANKEESVENIIKECLRILMG